MGDVLDPRLDPREMHAPTLSARDALLRLGVALVLGAVVGLERERGERSAGMRTHALVCLGSALITIVSAYGFTEFMANPSVRIDPGRIAAQIVSGVGFLGAGTIIFRREAVRGLTTAAGVWVVAGIGMATGAGMYLVAAAGAGGTLIILVFLKSIERQFFPHSQALTLRLRPRQDQLPTIRAAFSESGIRMRSLMLHPAPSGGDDVITISCHPASTSSLDRLLERLRAVPGLSAIEVTRTSLSGEPHEEDELPAEGSAP